MAKKTQKTEEEKTEEKVEEKKEEVLESSTEKEKLESVDTAEKAEVEGKKEKKEPQNDVTGIAYIYSSQNNTIVHITDLSGNTISKSSGGMVTKHSRLKADPTIAMFVAKRAAERAKDLGITSLYVRIRAKTGSEGTGPGAHSAVKSLDKEGFRILNVLDATRVPRGGPKRPYGKRGRRV